MGQGAPLFLLHFHPLGECPYIYYIRPLGPGGGLDKERRLEDSGRSQVPFAAAADPPFAGASAPRREVSLGKSWLKTKKERVVFTLYIQHIHRGGSVRQGPRKARASYLDHHPPVRSSKGNWKAPAGRWPVAPAGTVLTMATGWLCRTVAGFE